MPFVFDKSWDVAVSPDGSRRAVHKHDGRPADRRESVAREAAQNGVKTKFAVGGRGRIGGIGRGFSVSSED